MDLATSLLEAALVERRWVHQEQRANKDDRNRAERERRQADRPGDGPATGRTLADVRGLRYGR